MKTRRKRPEVEKYTKTAPNVFHQNVKLADESVYRSAGHEVSNS